jgi:hypothetical protein
VWECMILLLYFIVIKGGVFSHHSTAASVQSALQVPFYQVPHLPTTSEVLGVTCPYLIGCDPITPAS